MNSIIAGGMPFVLCDTISLMHVYVTFISVIIIFWNIPMLIKYTNNYFVIVSVVIVDHFI